MIPFGRQSCRYIGEISHPARYERSCAKCASAAPSSSVSSEIKSGCGSAKLLEQCSCVFEIGRVEALGEPAVDRGEEVAGFGVAALVATEPGEAHGSAQFPQLGLLLLGDAQGFAIEYLG